MSVTKSKEVGAVTDESGLVETSEDDGWIKVPQADQYTGQRESPMEEEMVFGAKSSNGGAGMELQQARATLSESLQALEGAFQAVAAAQRALDALEIRDPKHEKLGRECPTCGDATASEAHEDDDDDDASSIVTESSSGLPEVVQSYYSKERKVYIARQRLQELDADHLQDIFEREDTATALHETLSAGHEAGDTYSLRRQELCRTLQMAEKKAEAWRQACLAQEIDPAPFRFRSLSDHRCCSPLPFLGDDVASAAAIEGGQELPKERCSYENVVLWMAENNPEDLVQWDE